MRRTNQQNRALHKYCAMVAESLTNAGLDMRKTLKPEVEIPWSGDSVKEHMLKPIVKAMFDKESTTELTTKEVSEVYEVMSRHLGEKLGINVEFPQENEE